MIQLPWSQALRVSGALLAAVSLASVTAAAPHTRRSQPLSSFLRDLQAAGAPIVFSEALVRPDMRVALEQRRGPLRQALEEALASCGLEVRDGRSGRWLVVEGRALPAAASRPPAQTRMKPVHQETVEVLEPPTLMAGPLPVSLAATEVERTAGAFENVFRSLQLLPAVTPVNEAQGRFSVRSGGPDQNLTVVDGVEVHNPFRLEAIVSAFNPETVESFALTTGVMAARHGDRLASVLEVRTRPGRRDRLLRGALSLDAASGSLTLEGPLPANRGASWILSARRDAPGRLMERLTRMKALRGFEDLYLRVDWPWRDRAHLSFWTLQGRESTPDWLAYRADGQSLSADRPPIRYGRRLDHRTRTGTWAATIHGSFGPTLSSSTVLSRDTYTQASVETELFEPIWPGWREVQRRLVDISDLALRHSLAFRPSAGQRWEAGFEVHRLDTAWRMRGRGKVLAEWTLFRGPTIAPTTWGWRGEAFGDVAADSARDAVRSGAWLQGALAVAPGVVVEPGLRVQRSSINGETTVLPRVQAAWRLGRSRLSAAWGQHAQSPGFEKLLLSDAFVDYGGRARLSLRSERSQQAVLGLTRELGRRLSARLDLFETRFDRLIVGRVQPAREDGTAEVVTTIPENGGKGEAYGAELSLRLGAPTPKGVSGTFSYSYGVSRRESYGRVYPFDYDRRHALALTAELPVGRAMSLAAAWRAASGLPYTPFYAQPVYYKITHPAVRLRDLNSARHPFYSRLDLRAAFAPGGPGGRLELYLDVFNVLNYDVVDGSNGPGFKPAVVWGAEQCEVVERRDQGSAIVPSFGLRWRF